MAIKKSLISKPNPAKNGGVCSASIGNSFSTMFFQLVT
jgi:hypothetical protein